MQRSLARINVFAGLSHNTQQSQCPSVSVRPADGKLQPQQRNARRRATPQRRSNNGSAREHHQGGLCATCAACDACGYPCICIGMPRPLPPPLDSAAPRLLLRALGPSPGAPELWLSDCVRIKPACGAIMLPGGIAKWPARRATNDWQPLSHAHALHHSTRQAGTRRRLNHLSSPKQKAVALCSEQSDGHRSQ